MKVGDKTKGTICLTITHRVPVERTIKKFNNELEPPRPVYEYKLLGFGKVTKEDIIHFYDIDGDKDETFEEGETK